MATKEETDYVVKEIITPVRAYKVMGDGSPVVNHYYEMLTRRNIIPSSTQNEKVGTVTVQYVSNTGEKLRSDEIVAEEVPYEISKTYDLISGTTKVGEEKVVETLTPIYDATPKRHDTIIADKTGFTYRFDAIAFDSAPERSVIDKAQTIVKYVYRLVSKEDPTPVKKEVKGSVIVKYVDAEGNEIKPAETLINNAVLRTTYTYITKSGDKVVSTREEVGDWHIPDYNAKDKWVERITTEDGKGYEYQGVYAVSEKLNNTTAETGKVAEGITTVVYQYNLAKPRWEVPTDSPKEEVPEFKGEVENPELDKKGTVIVKYVDANGNKIADDVVVKDNVVVAKAKTNFKEAVNETTYTPTDEVYSITPKQTIEVGDVTYKLKGLLPVSKELKNSIEEKGLIREGVTTIIYRYVLQVEAPILEMPEYEGGVSSTEPPVLEVPEYEGGVVPVNPPIVDKPEYEGGVTPLDPPIVDIPEFEGGVVPLDPPIVDKPELKVPDEPTPAPKAEPMPESKPALKDPEKEVEPVKPVAAAQVKRLANTGSGNSNAAALGFGALIAGIALAVRKRQKEK